VNKRKTTKAGFAVWESASVGLLTHRFYRSSVCLLDLSDSFRSDLFVLVLLEESSSDDPDLRSFDLDAWDLHIVMLPA